MVCTANRRGSASPQSLLVEDASHYQITHGILQNPQRDEACGWYRGRNRAPTGWHGGWVGIPRLRGRRCTWRGRSASCPRTRPSWLRCPPTPLAHSSNACAAATGAPWPKMNRPRPRSGPCAAAASGFISIVFSGRRNLHRGFLVSSSCTASPRIDASGRILNVREAPAGLWNRPRKARLSVRR